MSLGNLKDQGNQGKNFTWQFGMLRALGKIGTIVQNIYTNLTTPKIELPVKTLIYSLGAGDTVINPSTVQGWISSFNADIVVVEVVNTTAGTTSIRYDLAGSFTFANRAWYKKLAEGDVLRLVGQPQLGSFHFSDELTMTGGYVNFTLYRITT